MGDIVKINGWKKKAARRLRPPRRKRRPLRLLLPAVFAGFAVAAWWFDLLPSRLDGLGDVAVFGAGASEAIVGRASIIDGDTLDIRDTRIRLHGIDAPESSQLCMENGHSSRCGQQAAFALANKIGSAVVSCEPRDRDRYNRIVAVCRAHGEDLNAWMVANGWALAYHRYSTDYVDEEERAAKYKAGIWQGDFVRPWEWRRAKRSEATETQQCLIKGNISHSGDRIYHVPGAAYYSRTRISTSKGERWFCSEADARAAGWRRSRR